MHGLRFFWHTYVEDFSCRLKRYGHINRVESSLASSNVSQQDATKAPKTSTRTMHCYRYIQGVYAKQIGIPLQNLVRRGEYREDYGLDGTRFESRSGQGIFSLTVQTESGAPPRLICNVYCGC